MNWFASSLGIVVAAHQLKHIPDSGKVQFAEVVEAVCPIASHRLKLSGLKFDSYFNLRFLEIP